MLSPVTHNFPPVTPFSDEIGWLRLDPAGNVRFANEAAADVLGYPDVRSLVAARHTLEEFVAGAFSISMSQPVSKRWRAFVVKSAAGKWICVHACPREISDHNIDFLLTGGAPAEWFHAPRQVLGSCDLSLLELSQSGLFIKSMDCQLLYVNRAHADMLGYEPEEMAGMPGRDVIHEDDLPRCMNMLFDKPWRVGEMREVQVRMRMKHDMGWRHVVIRQGRITHEGREAFIGSVRDVTDLRRGEQALKDYAKRLRRTSQQVLEVQENERRNLARELHDEVGQQLTLVKLSLAQLATREDSGSPVIEALDVVSALMNQIRNLSLDLRPSMLDDLGLAATLRWYAGRMAGLTSLHTRVEIDADFPRLSPEAETLVFRVAQEAVTNVMRHANARTLTVQLKRWNEGVELRVVDDGQGFDPDSVRLAAIRGKGAGLLGMQERAALGGAGLVLDSKTGAGTVLLLTMSGKTAGIRGSAA